MGELMAFSQDLNMQVTLQLHSLLNVVKKAHLEMQATLNDIQQYKLSWVMGGAATMP